MNPNIQQLIKDKRYQDIFDSIAEYTPDQLQKELSMSERCVLFIQSGLMGRLDVCESLASTVDLSSEEMTDAVVDVLIRDRIAQATKSGLVAGLIRNGPADDVVTRTRTGLLELATRCLNDIVQALAQRTESSNSILHFPHSKEEIAELVDKDEDIKSLDEAARHEPFSG
jgi:hypothetical protein